MGAGQEVEVQVEGMEGVEQDMLGDGDGDGGGGAMPGGNVRG